VPVGLFTLLQSLDVFVLLVETQDVGAGGIHEQDRSGMIRLNTLLVELLGVDAPVELP